LQITTTGKATFDKLQPCSAARRGLAERLSFLLVIGLYKTRWSCHPETLHTAGRYWQTKKLMHVMLRPKGPKHPQFADIEMLRRASA
jgi:hypothetical protein